MASCAACWSATQREVGPWCCGPAGARRRAARAPAKPAARPARASSVQKPPASHASERRRAPRHAYSRPVLAAGGGAARILIGRDLSSGGMRVAPCANLSVGDALKLVIYGPAGRPPLVIRAVVIARRWRRRLRAPVRERRAQDRRRARRVDDAASELQRLEPGERHCAEFHRLGGRRGARGRA